MKTVRIGTYVQKRRNAGLPVDSAYINRVAALFSNKGVKVTGVKAALAALKAPVASFGS